MWAMKTVKYVRLSLFLNLLSLNITKKNFFAFSRIKWNDLIKTGNFSKILYEEAKYMNWGAFFIDVLQIVGGLIAGLVAGFFLARNYMKKYPKCRIIHDNFRKNNE